jgi:(p)ppGpp synthase/HD superfamily hydrolase
VNGKPTIEDAIALAVQAHRGQRDKAGKPYILHPLRVMLRLEDEEAMVVAVLHDVVEDSSVISADLRDLGYPTEVLEALDAVTRRQGESYADFIDRAAENPLARRVKLADLADNMDLRRLADLTPSDCDRLARYKAAWRRLTSEGSDGPADEALPETVL